MDLAAGVQFDFAIKEKATCPIGGATNTAPGCGVMRRDDPFGPVRWFDIDPCYSFHVANAYDHGNSIVLHAVRYPEWWRYTD